MVTAGTGALAAVEKFFRREPRYARLLTLECEWVPCSLSSNRCLPAPLALLVGLRRDARGLESVRDLAEARPVLSPPLRALRRSLALLAASGSKRETYGNSWV